MREVGKRGTTVNPMYLPYPTDKGQVLLATAVAWLKAAMGGKRAHGPRVCQWIFKVQPLTDIQHFV